MGGISGGRFTVTKYPLISTSRNTPHFHWQIWWQEICQQKYIPSFLPADLVTVRKSASRNTPISTGRFGDRNSANMNNSPHFCQQICWQSGNLPAEIPISAGRFGDRNSANRNTSPHFCQQICWQSGNLPAEIPPFLLADCWQSGNLTADLLTVRKSASRNNPPHFCQQICWQQK